MFKSLQSSTPPSPTLIQLPSQDTALYVSLLLKSIVYPYYVCFLTAYSFLHPGHLVGSESSNLITVIAICSSYITIIHFPFEILFLLFFNAWIFPDLTKESVMADLNIGWVTRTKPRQKWLFVSWLWRHLGVGGAGSYIVWKTTR